MTTKATWLFDYRTDPQGGGRVQTGGWSESWYSNLSVGGAAIVPACTLWAQTRSLSLGQTTSIIGFRIQEVGSGNKAQVFSLAIPGAGLSRTDVPSMSARFIANSNESQNERLVVLRGLPDTWVTGGAVAWNPIMQQALFSFTNNLTRQAWRFRGRNLTFTQYPIISIANDGSVVTAEDTAFAEGDAIQVIRSQQQQGGRLRGGIYRIASMVDARHFTLAHWQWGSTSNGSIRSNGYVYPIAQFPYPLGPATVSVMQKKAGRSFFQYRGRRAKA